MKICTDTIRRYSKLILSTEHRGSDYGEYLFLNFEEKKLYIETDSFFGKISFDYDIDDHLENYENFYVNIRAFITLCEQYEELSLDSNIDDNRCVFYADDEKFEIPILEGEYDTSHFQYQNLFGIPLSIEQIKIIKDASRFTGVNDSYRNLSGIGVNKNILVASDSVLCYVATLSNEFPKFSLSKEAINLFSNVFSDLSVSLIINSETDIDNKIYFDFENGEAIIGIPKNIAVAVPDLINDKHFVNQLQIEESFVIEKQEFSDVLKFFESFVKLEFNQRLYLSIIEMEKVNITAVDAIKGNLILKMKSCSPEIICKSFYFSRSSMIPIISSIHDDFIRIKLSSNRDVPIFIITGETNESVYVIVSMFEDINNEADNEQKEE